VRIRRGEGGELGDVLGARAEALPPLEAIADVAQPLKDPLRALPVLPEVRRRGVGL